MRRQDSVAHLICLPIREVLLYPWMAQYFFTVILIGEEAGHDNPEGKDYED